MSHVYIIIIDIFVQVGLRLFDNIYIQCVPAVHMGVYRSIIGRCGSEGRGGGGGPGVCLPPFLAHDVGFVTLGQSWIPDRPLLRVVPVRSAEREVYRWWWWWWWCVCVWGGGGGALVRRGRSKA